ncbi:hypothetical protein ONA70_09700 [Micromonospora yasonensis]|uniref:hypothetical protein n=1 Tax=Micromonospora yasonensis TaxID=1128667 RepID=UPI00223152E0|nr:hypothetical protein [Micromonospora yasonensis]MCW3840368.1 hypothetical protein [Micromonospora yasonensis]
MTSQALLEADAIRPAARIELTIDQYDQWNHAAPTAPVKWCWAPAAQLDRTQASAV